MAGIAWDGAVTNRPGARFGPRAIREASHMLCDGTHPLFDVQPRARCSATPATWPCPTPACERMRAAMAPLAGAADRRHHMAWLGGDHSITLPLLRAYRALLGRPLAVIHFDAHCDTWERPFRRTQRPRHLGLRGDAGRSGASTQCFTQIGIRSAGVREAREYVRDQGGLIFTARELRGLESPAQLAPVLGRHPRAPGRARPAAAST